MPGHEWGFYLESNAETWMGFKQGSDRVRPVSDHM